MEALFILAFIAVGCVFIHRVVDPAATKVSMKINHAWQEATRDSTPIYDESGRIVDYKEKD